MLKKGGVEISLWSTTTVIRRWCRRRRHVRRRKGSGIRLGGKRRGFGLRCRPAVVYWRFMAGHFRMLKKLVIQMGFNCGSIEAYYLSLPFFRSHIFPIC
ncbi:hypothetical protein RND71_043148 [Anisodus tanguticus]|uniref:Uncharacterized protein n=1 Tax=Anisodus tanguticus TaxID=243964 RepID=A0AAE1QSC3_9SOLA|nr:hypothetical protein RND71_043148 [Anisodus tanguticus]